MPRYNVNQRRERPSRLDKLAELSALDAQQRASDEASLGGNLNLLSKLYGINQDQQLMPGRLEAQQLQNQGAGLANEGARFNLDWAQPRAMQQYETQDLGNKLTGTQLEQAPEVLRKLQLGNQQTEQFMPETLRGLRLGNDKSQNELDWYGPNAELQNRLGNAQVGLAEARAKNYMANAGIDPQALPYLVQMGIMTPEEAASLVLSPEQLQARANPPAQPMPPGAVAEDVLANAYGVGPGDYPQTTGEWLGQDIKQGLNYFMRSPANKTVNPMAWVFDLLNKPINY